jgi:hypothetical protein
MGGCGCSPDGTPIGVATPLATGAIAPVVLETLQGVAGDATPGWSLNSGSQARLVAAGANLVRVADPRPLEIRPSAIGAWGADVVAWNAGSKTATGQALPGTGETIAIQGLNRHEISLRALPQGQVTLDLGDGNHAFALHDALSPQSAELPAQHDGAGARHGPRPVGKTTLALQLANTLPSSYLDLEAAADRARLAEPAPFLERHEA